MHFETLPSDVSDDYKTFFQQQQSIEKVFSDKDLPRGNPSSEVERCAVCPFWSFRHYKFFHRYVPLAQSNSKVTSSKNFTITNQIRT